jgi:biopolymer transport protein ExbD
MVDMLTILIVFLLQSFSDDGSLVVAAPGVGLPVAVNGERVQTALSVEVTESAIRLDGTWICATKDVEASADPIIAPLAEALGRERMAADPKMLILCDRSREFAVLKKVLRTCGEAGFASPGLLVERSGS